MSKITTYRQLLSAIHENDGFNNWDSAGVPDEELSKLAESAEQDGLVKVVMGWGEDRYFRLTNKGRQYIGLPVQPSIFDRLISRLAPKRSAARSRQLR
ncbi:hypothetical protein [Rhizobium grahamii]|uniref:Uncharacterized protein n=1 Tax=Rhizobium grahamii CCGE 502 TaxID=990285 RepID=S3HA42_9HYPH|nr:hypothetical protein [Rhizobium grahamii]EPE95702.1 hypothetical protein RGCCGE502_22670 [Rhizobium grahamii CCGE 502]